MGALILILKIKLFFQKNALLSRNFDFGEGCLKILIKKTILGP
jgi:hypothetical protein